jgi:hypothetical protein
MSKSKSLDISDIRFSSSSIDDFFSSPRPVVKTATSGKTRVANFQALSGFHFLSSDTLVRTSQQDFWKLGQDADGFFIERLVSDDEGPVRES